MAAIFDSPREKIGGGDHILLRIDRNVCALIQATPEPHPRITLWRTLIAELLSTPRVVVKDPTLHRTVDLYCNVNVMVNYNYGAKIKVLGSETLASNPQRSDVAQ